MTATQMDLRTETRRILDKFGLTMEDFLPHSQRAGNPDDCTNTEFDEKLYLDRVYVIAGELAAAKAPKQPETTLKGSDRPTLERTFLRKRYAYDELHRVALGRLANQRKPVTLLDIVESFEGQPDDVFYAWIDKVVKDRPGVLNMPDKTSQAGLFDSPAAPFDPVLRDQNGDATEPKRLLATKVVRLPSGNKSTSFYAPIGWDDNDIDAWRIASVQAMEGLISVTEKPGFIATVLADFVFKHQPVQEVIDYIQLRCERLRKQQAANESDEHPVPPTPPAASAAPTPSNSDPDVIEADIIDDEFPTTTSEDRNQEPEVTPPAAPADTPEEATRKLWPFFFDEIRLARPDITEKPKAVEAVLEVIGYSGMMLIDAVRTLGADGVRDLWAKNKYKLTNIKSDPPAAPAPSNNPPATPPTGGSEGGALIPTKPQSLVGYKPRSGFVVPSEHEWQYMNAMARAVASTNFYKGVNTYDKAIFIMMKGYSIGIDPMSALEGIDIIEGEKGITLWMRSRLLKALAETLADCERFDVTATDELATATVKRKGREQMVFTYSYADAERAGLLNRPAWKANRKKMLAYRVISMATDLYFSEVRFRIGSAFNVLDDAQPAEYAEEF